MTVEISLNENNKSCCELTWLVCSKTFKWSEDFNNLTEEQKQEIMASEGLNSHLHWSEYKKYADEISEIWEKQKYRYCPKWNEGGNK